MKTESILAVSTIPATALASFAFHKGLKWSYQLAIPVAFCASATVAVSAAFIFREKVSEKHSEIFVGSETKTIEELLDETKDIEAVDNIFVTF
jgi:hypothetical protein